MINMFRKDERLLDPIDILSVANMEVAIQAASEIRLKFADIIPEKLSLDKLAKFIAQLNNNAHELEELGGSGLFLTALLMEHNCK